MAQYAQNQEQVPIPPSQQQQQPKPRNARKTVKVAAVVDLEGMNLLGEGFNRIKSAGFWPLSYS